MPVSTLNLTQVRNFKSATFEFSPDINLVFGENGSGKTTILESLFVLGSGRSFRAPQLNKIIQKDTDGSLIEAELTSSNKISEALSLKMRKKQQENAEYFISQQPVGSVCELAKFLPVQLLNLHGYLLLGDAPEQRRRFIDWMMFHVEHSFMQVWQIYQRTLKQRNAALKMRSPESELMHWTSLLADAGQKLHDLRFAALTQWIAFAKRQCADLPGVYDMEMQYKPGWSAEGGQLAEALFAGLGRDKALGYTHAGPHRADLSITLGGFDAAHILSTGQQKTFVGMLQISQSQWMMEQSQSRPILLIDDLPSELDISARELLAHKISGLQAQVFMTSVNKDGFYPFIKNRDYKMFHVEHGIGKVV